MIQRRVSAKGVPAAGRLRRWARAALERRRASVTVRVVGEQESRLLNRQFRGKDKPTNVLSFPYEGPRAMVCGDLVVCAPVVAREAREQGKAPGAHWAHMVVHGVLHLRGFDHLKPREARRMEALERRLLSKFSIPDPY